MWLDWRCHYRTKKWENKKHLWFCIFSSNRSSSYCPFPIDWSSLGIFPVVLSLVGWEHSFHQNCLNWRQVSCSSSGWEDRKEGSLRIPEAMVQPYHVKIFLTVQASQDGADMFSESTTLQLAPYGNYYQNLGGEDPLQTTYELLTCFKKDMHKVRTTTFRWWWWWWWWWQYNDMVLLQVETYLTVAKCRLSPEANCTL